jgi:hypothetical protein
MPAKTKYRNRKNKTRRYNNKTKRHRRRQSKCSLAKLMRGGDGDTPTPPATEVSEESSGTEVEKEEEPIPTEGSAESYDKTEPVTTPPATEIENEEKTGPTDTAESSGKEIEGEDVEKEEPVPTTPATEVSAEPSEEKEESVPTPAEITIHYYNSSNSTVVEIKPDSDSKYKDLFDAEHKDDAFIVIMNDGNDTKTDISSDSVVVDVENNANANIFTYKYKNVVDNNKSIDDIPKISIMAEDLEKVNTPDVIGNQLMNTNYYIDDQGILREYNIDDNTTIQKVLITDVPEPLPVENENSILTSANKVLNDLGDLLKNIKDSMPPYIEVLFKDNSYIISKENPYIVVQNEV